MTTGDEFDTWLSAANTAFVRAVNAGVDRAAVLQAVELAAESGRASKELTEPVTATALVTVAATPLTPAPQQRVRWEAVTIVAACMVISFVLGMALLAAVQRSGQVSALIIPTSVNGTGLGSPTTIPHTSDDSGNPTGQNPPPAGYQQVTGPAGLKTAIPSGWPTSTTIGPGTLQATDPTNTHRYIRYGGSTAPSGTSVEDSLVHYEHDYATHTPGYVRIVLSSATYGGHGAVLWEFEFDDGGTTMHVRSLYWRAGSTEYFVLAAAPTAIWPAMQPIYDTMVASATP